MNYSDMQKTNATDARTNTPVPPVDFDVREPADLARLRALWAQMPALPKLVGLREEGENHSWPGLDVRTLLRGEESAGRYSFHSIIMAPGSELTPHSYTGGAAFWFVIEGSVVATVGSVTETLENGAFFYAPEDTTQAVANRSAQPVHLFVGYHPAGADRAFAAAHRLWRESTSASPEAYGEVLARHGFVLTKGAPLPNDAKVNQVVPRIDAPIEALEDLVKLRDTWAQLRPTPKIVASPRNCWDLAMQSQDAKLMLSPEESAAAASVFWGGLAKGVGAPPHHQPTEEEIFIVQEGPVQLTIGNRTATVQKGAFGFAPRYSTHAFRNDNDKLAALITMNSPGGHDRGFEFAVHDAHAFLTKYRAYGFEFHVDLKSMAHETEAARKG